MPKCLSKVWDFKTFEFEYMNEDKIIVLNNFRVNTEYEITKSVIDKNNAYKIHCS